MDSPVEYPVVKIRDRAFTVKCGLLAELHLSRQSIGVGDALKRMPRGGGKPDPRILSDMMDLWAACTAENFVAAGEPVPTADQWALRIPPEQWGECCKAVSDALVKALRLAVQPPAPAADLASATPN